MPASCAICDKQKSIGHFRKLLRGHRNVTGKRTFKPNLQLVSYQGRKQTVCVKCIKNLARTRTAKKVAA